MSWAVFLAGVWTGALLTVVVVALLSAHGGREKRIEVVAE